jgi:monoamine oxidase
MNGSAAPPCYKPGQMQEFWPHVAYPEGQVHFAGDHTSPWIRWMQGALFSGIRAAREVNEAAEKIPSPAPIQSV